MIFLSHKAAQVMLITAKDKSHVKTGAQILTLDTIDEDLKIARLSALEELRSILAQRLSDPIVGINRKVAQIAVDTATTLQQYASGNFLQQMEALALGNTVDAVTVAQYAASATAAPFQTKKAQLQQQLLELQLTESSSINDLIKNHIQVELMAANALKGAATLTALSDGKVHLKVVQGAFVKKGELLFEIG